MTDSITSDQLREETFSGSENHFRTIFNESPLGVAVIDSLTGHIYDANPAYAQIAGRSIEELRSLDWMKITHPDDIQEDLDNMARMNAGEISGFKMQKRYIQPDSSVRWINMTIASMQVEDKSKPRHLCMTEDITDRVQVEEMEKINQEKSEFLANMSHELRTPMHGILSFAHFGLKNVDKGDLPQLAKYFDRIDISAKRLLSLINDLLDLSKLEAGKMEFTFKEIKLDEILDACINEQTALMKSLNLTSNVEIKAPTIVLCDYVKISQVIINMLSNAIKFSDQNSVIKIIIASEPLSLLSGKIVDGIKLTVINCGVSIPKDELNSIFDKFVQSSNTKSEAGGTGLGLSICSEIIKGHQGKIWANNETCGGVAFSFVIPVAGLVVSDQGK